MQQENNQNIEVTREEFCQIFGDERPEFVLRATVIQATDTLRALSSAAASSECDGASLCNALGMLAEKLEAAASISSRAVRVAS